MIPDIRPAIPPVIRMEVSPATSQEMLSGILKQFPPGSPAWSSLTLIPRDTREFFPLILPWLLQMFITGILLEESSKNPTWIRVGVS